MFDEYNCRDKDTEFTIKKDLPISLLFGEVYHLTPRVYHGPDLCDVAACPAKMISIEEDSNGIEIVHMMVLGLAKHREAFIDEHK